MQFHRQSCAFINLKARLGLFDLRLEQLSASPFDHDSQKAVPEKYGCEQYKKGGDHDRQFSGGSPWSGRQNAQIGG